MTFSVRKTNEALKTIYGRQAGVSLSPNPGRVGEIMYYSPAVKYDSALVPGRVGILGLKLLAEKVK